MLPLILRVILCLSLTSNIAVAISWSKPNCQEKCGNVTIPYPFGVGPDCSANSSFTIICQNSSTPWLPTINMEVLNISVQGAVVVRLPVLPMSCTNEQRTESLLLSLEGSPFTISARYNSLAVLGCRNVVWLRPNKTTTVGGCMAICDADSADSTCNGVNCCQTTIPSRLQQLNYTYQTLQTIDNTVSCGYAFPVDRRWFQEDYRSHRSLHANSTSPYDSASPYEEEGFHSAPLVLEWEYPNEQRSSNSRCLIYDELTRTASGTSEDYSRYYYDREYDYRSSTSYCSCAYGFDGNPYLLGGCSDIDECSDGRLHACYNATCFNLIGGYRCQGAGYEDDNKQSRVKIAFISIGSALGGLLLLSGAGKSAKAIRKKIKANRRHRFFKRNGGLLLEQQISSTNNGLEKTKLFSSKELAQATDRYNENRILGHGSQGTVYKGMLTDGKIVAVKKSKMVEEGDLEVFINEVVILSQVNHRNIVKLLGCCLETEVPLLVYEFIPNGTLFQHVHDPGEEFTLSWEMRVRIAREVAGALAYLHSAASVPIYHRDIKSTNILLDDKYRPKISDFGTSRSVAIDQTHLTTRVLGTFGYLDPEYFQSSQFTEKSDVYSFGVVMVELLTGERAISSIIRAEVGRSLATHFLHSMEENQLFEILDERVLEEGKREEIVVIAELARRCLHLSGKRRPTMKEVAVELEGIQMVKEGSNLMQNQVSNIEPQFVELAESYDFSTVLESMRFDDHPLI